MPNVTDSSQWLGMTTAAYCFYNNTTDDGEQNKCGAIYNWYAVDSEKLAPDGWRIPSSFDWDTSTGIGAPGNDVGLAPWLHNRVQSIKEIFMQTDIKSEAMRLVQQLPANSTWNDLMYEIYPNFRSVVPKWLILAA